MISKIEKSKRYAEEPERVGFDSFVVHFRGTHETHQITYTQGVWSCECAFFAQRGVCSHTMALERILEPMLSLPLGATGDN